MSCTPKTSSTVAASPASNRRNEKSAKSEWYAISAASPGTYDHKHVTRIGGVTHCVAYGPGVLDLAHQPDEWCAVDDVINATKVIALALLELAGAST